MSAQRRAAVVNARWWASTLTSEQLARAIPHCRNLWACTKMYGGTVYDTYYPLVIGVYRAELASRAAIAKAKGSAA